MDGPGTGLAVQRKNAPPYLAHKTFINFVNGLRQGIPARVDKSVMQSLSGATQGQLIATLKYFNLINVEGVPTDLLAALVQSEGAERQRLFREILTRSYRFIFTSQLDLERATKKQIEELFVEQGIGGETLRKAYGLFLALAEAGGIRLSPHVKTARARSAGSHRRRSLSSQKMKVKDGHRGGPKLAWPQLLISKFPSFDPNWSDKVKARWFDSFEELMKRTN